MGHMAPWRKAKLALIAAKACRIGDVHRDKERLVARRLLHRHLPLRLILEIEVGKQLADSKPAIPTNRKTRRGGRSARRRW